MNHNNLNNNYIYSIIIPHYNIPHLLKRLLYTIPHRDDLQVIVVDDCSIIHIEELAQLKEESKNIEWYSTGINGGGGKARNIGLKHAIGKYILFADADDLFEHDLDNILTQLSLKEFDIAYFKGCSRDPDNLKRYDRADHLNNFIEDYLTGKDPEAYNLRYKFGEPWCKIIRKEIIIHNNITFDEIPIHNDTKFSYLVGYFSKNIIVSSRILYCVTEREGSVSKAISNDRILTRIRVFGEAEAFLVEKGISIYQDYHYIQLINLLIHCRFSLFLEGLLILKQQGLNNVKLIKGFITSLISVLRSKLSRK